MNVTQTLADIEKDVIKDRLKFHGNNKTRTAQSLGICIRTLDNKLAEYAKPGLEIGNGKERSPAGDATEGGKAPSQGSGQKADASNDNSNTGVRVESASENTEKQSVSMRKRKEVQTLLHE